MVSMHVKRYQLTTSFSRPTCRCHQFFRLLSGRLSLSIALSQGHGTVRFQAVGGRKTALLLFYARSPKIENTAQRSLPDWVRRHKSFHRVARPVAG